MSSRELGVPEHAVIKTLMFEDESGHTMVVLMHGDCQVSARELARQTGKRSTQPCSLEKAEKASGYKVGGISPFAQRKVSPIFAEATIRELPYLYINGGGRGFLIGLTPQELERVLQPQWVTVARGASPPGASESS